MINQFLQKCDFIGVTPRLFFKGSFRFKTQIGGFLSLILSLFSFVISVYFIYIFFSKKTFTLYENIVTKTRAQKIYSRQDFSIILLDKYFQKIENSSQIYSIYADIWTDKRYYEQGEYKSKTVIVPVSIEKCNVSSYEKYYYLWKDEKLINESTCFSQEAINENINSTGVYGETGYTGIVFWLSLCTNTSTKNDCYPLEKSREILDNVFVYVKILDTYFNHGNLDNNAIEYIRSELIQASSSNYKRQWYLFQEVEYLSDDGILFIKQNKKTLTTLSSSYNSVDNRVNPTIENAFFALSLNMDGTKKIINRKYYKVQNLFSDINGLFQIAYFFCFSVNFIYCYNRMNQNIINHNINNYIEHSNENNIFTKKNSMNNTNSVLLNNTNLHRQSSYAHYKNHKFNISNFSQANLNRVRTLFNNNYTSSLTPLNNRRRNNNEQNKKNDNKESKETPLLSSEKNRKKIYEMLENKFHKIKIYLNCFQLMNPQIVFCPITLIHHKNRKLRNFAVVTEIILNQLDISNLLKKINFIDKFNISFFRDEKIRGIFSQCFNPQTKIFFKTLLHDNTYKSKNEEDEETNLLKEIINFEIIEKISAHHGNSFLY